jgi:hypothetical protein
MKLLCLMLLLFPLLATAATQTDLKVVLSDFTSTPAAGRTVFVQALSTPTASASSTILGTRLTFVSDFFGIFYISNVTQNVLYKFDIQAPPSKETFMVFISPTDTGLINAHSNMVASSTATFPAGAVAWSAASQDLRYPHTNQVQSPWVSDINGGGFSLSNVGAVTAAKTTNSVGTYLTSGSSQISLLAPYSAPGQGGISILFTNPVSGNALSSALDLTTNGLTLNLGTFTATTIADSGLTSSRMVLTDGSKNFASAAASGVVPIDADGSATTFSQINTLAPGNVMTNGGTFSATWSNHFRVDAAHAFFPSNATVSKVAVIAADNSLTNSGLGAVSINGDGTATTAVQINNLNVGSILTNAITSQSANYNVQNTDYYVLLNGNLTATLPSAVGIPGKQFVITCKTAGTNGILTTSSQTFLGYGQTAATKWTNSVVGRSTKVYSDGANWVVEKSDN